MQPDTQQAAIHCVFEHLTVALLGVRTRQVSLHSLHESVSLGCTWPCHWFTGYPSLDYFWWLLITAYQEHHTSSDPSNGLMTGSIFPSLSIFHASKTSTWKTDCSRTASYNPPLDRWHCHEIISVILFTLHASGFNVRANWCICLLLNIPLTFTV